MARQSKRGPKVTPIAHDSGGNVAVEDPPEAPAQPEPQTEKPQAGPPWKKKPRPDPIPKHMTFFGRVKTILKADWGTRAKLKVYRLEPIIDRLRGSENKYICIYQEPIDEERLKADHGSGRYRIYLNYKEPAGNDKELDSIELDILDPNYPPNIPDSEWVDDSRNKRWQWARNLKKQQPGQPPAAGVTLENAYSTVLEIQDRERERGGEGKSKITEFTEMLSAVTNVLPKPQPSTDNAVLTAVVTMMTNQIQTSQQEVKELRAQLMLMLTERNKPGGETLETIVAKAETFLPKIKQLLDLGGERVADVVRARNRPWYEEVAIQAIPPVAQYLAPVVPMLVNAFLGGRPPGGQAPGPNMQPVAQPPAAAPGIAAPAGAGDPMQEARMRLGQYLMVNMKPLRDLFDRALKGDLRDPEEPEDGAIDGTDFAHWCYQFHGAQAMQDARYLGTAQIIAMFKAVPMYWQPFAAHEARITQFLDQALRYEYIPEEKDGDGDNQPDAEEDHFPED